jgi:hypothetical protein
MRAFKDEQGRGWVASVREDAGLNYKGRHYFLVEPEAGDADEAVALKDVRWNNERTAERTLETMSEVELRRRLRQARGRGRQDVGAA